MPTLEKGDIVIAVKGSETAAGDLVAFYYENNILIKRCIAVGPQQVAMDQAGNVYVNGELLAEDYLNEKSFGESDISFPYQVPLGHSFCLGDHRAVSLDSRHRSIGAISEERIIGKVVFRIWPLSKFGRL